MKTYFRYLITLLVVICIISITSVKSVYAADITRREELQLEGTINDFFHRNRIKKNYYLEYYDAYPNISLKEIIIYIYPKEGIAELVSRRFNYIEESIKHGINSTILEFPDFQWAKTYKMHIINRGIKLGEYKPLGNKKFDNINCTLKHSASARLDNKDDIDIHVSDKDNIEVRIEGIGNHQAIFNKKYRLVLIKRTSNAFYYSQDFPNGVITWAYFPREKILVYSKVREFPMDDKPDSYIMIGKCQVN